MVDNPKERFAKGYPRVLWNKWWVLVVSSGVFAILGVVAFVWKPFQIPAGPAILIAFACLVVAQVLVARDLWNGRKAALENLGQAANDRDLAVAERDRAIRERDEAKAEAPPSTGIELSGTQGGHVRDQHIEGFDIGISITGGKGHEIAGGHLQGPHTQPSEVAEQLEDWLRQQSSETPPTSEEHYEDQAEDE